MRGDALAGLLLVSKGTSLPSLSVPEAINAAAELELCKGGKLDEEVLSDVFEFNNGVFALESVFGIDSGVVGLEGVFGMDRGVVGREDDLDATGDIGGEDGKLALLLLFADNGL